MEYIYKKPFSSFLKRRCVQTNAQSARGGCFRVNKCSDFLSFNIFPPTEHFPLGLQVQLQLLKQFPNRKQGSEHSADRHFQEPGPSQACESKTSFGDLYLKHPCLAKTSVGMTEVTLLFRYSFILLGNILSAEYFLIQKN